MKRSGRCSFKFYHLFLHLMSSKQRTVFGSRLSDGQLIWDHIAHSRAELDAARLLVLECATIVDEVAISTEKSLQSRARQLISEIKLFVPEVCCRVIDRAIQTHSGMGLCQDTFLAKAWAGMRSLRIADGPDEVHARVIAKCEFSRPMNERGGRSEHIKPRPTL
eukprot:497538_1